MTAPYTLPFKLFWQWLLLHPNCIMRAGTPEATLYDHEDLHWQLLPEEEEGFVIQLVRGKRLMGELFLEPEQVSFVQVVGPNEHDEHLFELVSEAEQERYVVCYFALIHGFDVEDGELPPGKVH